MQHLKSIQRIFSVNPFEGRLRFLVGIGILLFPLLFGSLTLFPDTMFSLGLTSTAQIIIAVILILSSFIEAPKDNWNTFSLAALILTIIYLFSDIGIRRFNYLGTSSSIYLYATVFICCVYLHKYKSKFIENFFGFFCIALCMVGFFSQVKSGLIFTDDHPSFLYRLIQLKNNFPTIPFYNPDWNAGVEAREFFASGVLNIFIIFSPIIYLFNVEKIYSLIVACTLFIFLPISFYQASKLFNLSKTGAWISVVLGLTHSILWYRWALSYGTMGFVLSMILVPLNLALLCSFVAEKSTVSIKKALTFSILISLMLLWSLSFIVFLPAGLVSLFLILKTENLKNFLLSAVLIFILTSPWAYVFYNASNVGKFISVSETEVKSETEIAGFDQAKFRTTPKAFTDKNIIEKIVYAARKNISPINPLLLFFGMFGFFIFSTIRSRLIVMTFCLAAIFLAFIVSIFKPQLELDRMAMALSLVLVLPASALFEYVLKNNKNIFVTAATTSILLVLPPNWLWRVTSNQTVDKYTVASPLVWELANKIKEHSHGGRTLFAGFSLHELDGGHLAPLPAWSEAPLIAKSFQHDKWKYEDVIPLSYRAGKQEGVLEFYDLMNVSLVVSQDKFWRKWFRARPAYFEEVWKGGKFRMFKVKKFKNDYFLEGQGEILSQNNGIVRLNLKSESATIKFNYLPFLKSSNCLIKEKKIGQDVNFIELLSCEEGVEVVIEAKNVIERFLH